MRSIDWARWAVSGLAATLVMTLLSTLAQGLHLTRMNMPWLLGSMVTENRDRAQLLGSFVHLANGWIFSLAYALLFGALGGSGVLRGLLLGLFHALFVLAVILPLLPVAHPNMAGPRAGPMGGRRLEPPGFFALHYGYQTPLVVVLSHAAFGIVFGWLY